MRLKKKHKKLGSVLGDNVLRVFLILLIVFSVFPFIYMFLLSFMHTTTMKLSIERLMNAEWTINNYLRLYTGVGAFQRYLWNTAVVSVYACAVTCLTSAMAAYAFAKKRFFGRNALYTIYLMTMMIPGQALLIPTFLIVRGLGLLNTYTGLALPTTSAFGVILVRSFMKGIPDDLLEAADIDGCSEARKFVNVVLPLIRPAMVSLAIFTFISVWGSLLWPLVAASGDMTMVSQAVANMRATKVVDNYGLMMAASTSAFMPPFILYIFLQKQFVEGIALSGIKG